MPPGTYGVGLSARNRSDETAQIEGLRIKLLVLTGVQVVDPTTRTVTNPLDSDDDGDGFTEIAGDCDDANAAVHPFALELMNGIDDDCDGVVDGRLWFRDADADGFGNALDSVLAAVQPAGFVAQGGDCDDAKPSVHPGAAEIPGNGIDDDCDGQVDE